ncbi:MAG: LPP20 family lipoprotein [Selenomonadaceae bacterium]|nr:LPP20 family lipoprotein [Selenomonadaceae bacterium]
MKKLFTMLLMTCLMVFSVTLVSATELPMDDEDYIIVKGFGEAGQSMSAGIRAAELDAYRKAFEAVNEINLDSETTVEKGITTQDYIHTKLKGVLRRARIINEGPLPEGGYYAEVRVPIWGVQNSVASTVLKPNNDVQPFPQPQFPQPTGSSSGGYTGLIIDCSGLGLETAMSPVILNESGNPIYGYENLNYDVVVSRGMASYSTSTSSSSRAGSNPLRIKAKRIDGTRKCNPVVSDEDASRILHANSSSHFLDNCAVVLVQ